MATLEISLYQADDDGITSFRLAASNDSFSGVVLVWGDAEVFGELAIALKGFPQTTSAKVVKQLGSPGVGICNLDFYCVDGSGHAVVWIRLESEYPIFPSNRYESISMCIRIEAASVDEFVLQLQSLAAGETEKATLYGS